MCRLSVREGRASDEHFEMSRQVGRWGLGRKEDVGEVGEAIGRAQERAWAPAIHVFFFGFPLFLQATFLIRQQGRGGEGEGEREKREK